MGRVSGSNSIIWLLEWKIFYSVPRCSQSKRSPQPNGLSAEASYGDGEIRFYLFLLDYRPTSILEMWRLAFWSRGQKARTTTHRGGSASPTPPSTTPSTPGRSTPPLAWETSGQDLMDSSSSTRPSLVRLRTSNWCLVHSQVLNLAGSLMLFSLMRGTG